MSTSPAPIPAKDRIIDRLDHSERTFLFWFMACILVVFLGFPGAAVSIFLRSVLIIGPDQRAAAKETPPALGPRK